MKKLIVVSDWVADTLTCQEFSSAFYGFLIEEEKPLVTFVSSTPSTIHTAFLLNQIVLTEERLGDPLNTVIFVNTDPRLQSTTAVEKAEGAKFVIIKLKSGMLICGPNAGYCFSMIKNKIDEIFIYQGFEKGSQFRSRDLYSRVCAHLIEEKIDELDLEEYFLSTIPELEGFYVCHIDNFGNIKTNIRLSDFKGKYEFGDLVNLEINNVKKKAKFVNNLFGGEVGELVIYPGSSGAITDPFLEIAVWQHYNENKIISGESVFNKPRIGEKIYVLNY
jgi:hypothetical protein